MYKTDIVRKTDPEIADAIEQELARQRNKIELIASENFVSEAVMQAMGSPLTNKYAEGYPGKRYYGGCEYVDIVENLAIERAKKLFGAEHANVQPHSGAQANMAVFFAMLKPGDKILGMSLADGGHLGGDVGQHAGLGGDGPALLHLLEPLQHPGDAFHRVVHRVEAQHRIPHPEGKALQQ